MAGLILLAGPLFLNSCESNSKEVPTHAHISGEIVNPRSKYLIILKDNEPLDTVYLDSKNRFSHRVENVKAGLYLFQHPPETQGMYLQPGDSLLFRVNTMEFDESLHFSGKGGDKNNLLAEMYLLDENNSDLLLSYYKTEPADFHKKTDSIKNARLNLLQAGQKKHNFPPDFTALAEKIVLYENYDLKERYTYLVNKYYRQFSGKFPENFHDYRKSVDFNEYSLQSSPGYKRFIENYLINMSLLDCAKSNLDNRDCSSLTDNENIKSRINKVDELTEIPSLRQHFFSKLGALGIIMATEREEILDILALLKEKGLSNDVYEDFRHLGTIQLAYLPGANISEVNLLNPEGKIFPFGEVLDGPSIIFIWSKNSAAHLGDHQLVTNLQEKYPEIDFIGINVDVGETAGWQTALQKYGYDSSKEYQLYQTSVKKKFFKYYLNKLIFVDASGEVVIGDAYLNSPELEGRILEFLNR